MFDKPFVFNSSVIKSIPLLSQDFKYCKVAVFVSSHLLSEMQLMCDKIAIINKGKIVNVDNVNNQTK